MKFLTLDSKRLWVLIILTTLISLSAIYLFVTRERRMYAYDPQPDGTWDTAETIHLVTVELQEIILDKLNVREFGPNYHNLDINNQTNPDNAKFKRYNFCNYKILGTIDSTNYTVAYLKYACGSYLLREESMMLSTGRNKPVVFFISPETKTILAIEEPTGRYYVYDREHLFPELIKQREVEMEQNGLRKMLFEDVIIRENAEQYFADNFGYQPL